ncbi:MAG TPA: hypothetical protein VIU33_07860 [Nitrospiria bacterium]
MMNYGIHLVSAIKPRALFGALVAVVVFPAVSLADHDVKFSEEVGKTKHNLSANPDVNATGTTQVCIFCHTPHGANPVATGQAPLWNRLLPDDTSYEVYSSPNFDQQDFGGIHRPKGVSLACLSCHDGGIALDSLINGPQSGGYLPSNSGTGVGPGTRAPGINFIGGGLIEADGSFMEGSRDSFEVETSPESPYSGGLHDLVHGPGGGSEGAQPFPNLGRDLSDDHPIGMEVPCSTDPQFTQICRDLTSLKLDGGSDGTHVAFISRTTEKNSLIWPVEKRDRLRLYPSTEEPGRYFVECASCHNPHAPRVSFLRLPSRVPDLVDINLLPTDLDNNPALRTWGQRPNAGSAICLSCHEK